MRTGIGIGLSPADQARLAAVAADRNSPQQHVWRWQERLRWRAGVDGRLRDRTRPARIPPLDEAVAAQGVALTLTAPPGETAHWTAAAMATACAVSVSPVHRIWRSHSLQPHQVRQFKLSRNPQFAAIAPWRSDCEADGGGATGGMRDVEPRGSPDIVGLYVAPRPMRSCCRWMGTAKSRRSTAPSPACR